MLAVALAALSGCGGSDSPCGDSGSCALQGGISGLSTSGLVLSNGTQTLTVASGAGQFSFGGSYSTGAAYSVSVVTQPPGRDQVCTVSNGSGAFGKYGVGGLAVSCRATDWAVTTFAGAVNLEPVDGTGIAAAFSYPAQIAIDSANNLYVADQGIKPAIRKITPAGVVTSPAVTQSNAGGLALAPNGDFYTATFSSHYVMRTVAPSTIITLAGQNGVAGFSDGTGTSALFNVPSGIASDSAGNIYVADQKNNRIRKVTPAGVVTTVAGSGAAGSADGPGTTASFNLPTSVKVAPSGDLYVADTSSAKIRKITPAGVVTTVAGNGTSSYVDGPAASASFTSPTDIAFDANGNIFVVDYYKIRKITAAGVVSTVAGSGAIASVNGSGAAASFFGPQFLVVDSSGNIFVSDSKGYQIRRIEAR